MIFRNEYFFLSNMFPCVISYKGKTYKCVESAFQAQKCEERASEFEELNGFNAKELGKKVKLRKDWEKVKVGIMREILIEKFSQNPTLLIYLKEVNVPIIEDNTWGDTFWGMCNRKGENNLGKLLEEIKAMKIKKIYIKISDVCQFRDIDDIVRNYSGDIPLMVQAGNKMFKFNRSVDGSMKFFRNIGRYCGERFVKISLS